MANTFTLTSHNYQGRYLYLECSQVKDIANNRSTINWKLSSIGGQSNYYSTGPTTITIGGSQVYYCRKVEWDEKVFPAAKGSTSGSLTVNHNTQGDLTISVSMSTNIYDGVIRTFNGNWTLDSIPRQATITSAPDFNDTQLPTVTYSNPAGNNVEALDICIADDKARDVGVPYRPVNKTGSLSYKFTASDVTALKNRTLNSLALTFVLRTKIGGQYFYSSIPKTFTMTENDDTKPVVRLSVSINNDSLPSAFDGLYIQRKSRVNVSISADGRYGSKISSYWANVDGKGYTSVPFTSDVIQSAGLVSISGSAKDARGFSNTDRQQVNVIEYAKPTVVQASCYRSDENGNRKSTSTSVWIKAARSYHKVVASGSQKNFCKLQWRRKLSTEAWNDSKHQWSDLIARTDLSTDEYSGILSGVEFDLTKSYTVQIRAIDDLGEFTPYDMEVPTRDVALHLRKGGNGAAFGGYAEEEDMLDVGWNMRVNKNLYAKGSVNGAYIRTVRLAGTNLMTLKTSFSAFSPTNDGSGRQSFFLFCTDGETKAVYGMVIVNDKGSIKWFGTGGDVTGTSETDGTITLALPRVCWDMVTVISAGNFEISTGG